MLSPSHLQEKKRILAREEAAPALETLFDLLLRGGVYSLLEFLEHELPRDLEPISWESWRSSRKDAARPPPRINPECLRTVLKRCGVLLNPADYRLLLRAYGDAVGFVLVEELVEALSPLRRLPLAVFHQIQSALRIDGGREVAAITLDSLIGAFLPALLGPLEATANPGIANRDGSVGGGAENALEEILRADFTEAERCFAASKFPDGVVPLRTVWLYVSGLLLMTLHDPPTSDEDAALGSILLDRLDYISRATSSLLVSSEASLSDRAPDATGTLGSRRERKFERYDERDRLDEWRIGREERGARDGYLRHVVGYAGHLPSFKTHFGRTFHVIEEDLPKLTQPRPPKPPLPLDAYGPAIKLQYNRMSEHHFKFS
ncbi:unnamed protein product [Phytomonas sp. Hart1]|nr:unnamed protein product [Phytomonas sp. Hart1]|eukprot:CCW70878.1 unnamed protein product [Phytomonas sp. isolate Hart1]